MRYQKDAERFGQQNEKMQAPIDRMFLQFHKCLRVQLILISSFKLL